MTVPHQTPGASSRTPLGRSPALLCLAAALLSVTGCTSVGSSDGAARVAQAPSVVVPSVSPAPVRVPAARLDAVPAPGTVRVEEGPFTDRLSLAGLSLQDGNRVTGRVTNTADVSELIVLELQADFYDATGRLLGSAKTAYADEEFTDTGATLVELGPDEAFPVSVDGRPAVEGAASAVVTVPQLVNE